MHWGEILATMLKFLWRKKKRRAQPAIRTALDYYRLQIYGRMDLLGCPHPNRTLWLRKQLLLFCKKRLSTACIPLLEEFSETTEDAIVRKLLVRKSFQLRKDYLNSFKEYSDRRLILLTQRSNLLENWEGIYILGCFGGDDALSYLNDRFQVEPDPTLMHALRQAMLRIERRKNTKTHAGDHDN